MRVMRALLAATVLAVLAACSGGGSTTASSTSSTSQSSSSSVATTTSTSSPATPEEAVKAAYLAYWKMVDRLVAAPNSNDSEIAEKAVDPALSNLRDTLSTDAAKGETRRIPVGGRYSHRLDSVSIANGSAEIVDCHVDDKVVYSASGVVLDDATSTGRLKASLVLAGDRWLVSNVQVLEQYDGIAGCAA
jgi:hypothetical protein